MALSSCSKDEPIEVIESINNTTWIDYYGSVFDDSHFVIKFTSESEFQEYMAELDGSISSTGVNNGTYTYKDDKGFVVLENRGKLWFEQHPNK